MASSCCLAAPRGFPLLLRTLYRAPAALMAMESPANSVGGDSNVGGKWVVVCGGGLIGACTAFFLAEKGAERVTVVEKSAIMCAASGKADSFLALDWCDGEPLSALAHASFRLHRLLAETLYGPETYGYRPVHTLSLPLSSSAPVASSSTELPPCINGLAAGLPRTIGTTDTTTQIWVYALVSYSSVGSRRKEVGHSHQEPPKVKPKLVRTSFFTVHLLRGEITCNVPARQELTAEQTENAQGGQSATIW